MSEMRGTTVHSRRSDRAPLGVRDDVLEHGDRHALRHAGALVDALVGARLERDALDDLGDEVGHAHGQGAARRPRLLLRDRHPELDRLGIVRHDLAADAVLERRDDLAARRVVLGVRGEAEQHVERKADGIAFDLDVAFLHDVEQAHLHLAGEIGQLVEREDAAIGARQHPVVDRQLVGEHVSAARRLDRIDDRR